MKYLRQFLIIALVSFVGEALSRFIPLPVPGGVYGIVILFLLLCLTSFFNFTMYIDIVCIPYIIFSRLKLRNIIENIMHNNIGNRMYVHNFDLKDVRRHFSAGSFDAVVSNPPFMQVDGGLKTDKEELLCARMEICCTIDDVCEAASYLLKFGGAFSLVYRPSRLADLFFALNKHNLAPKRMRLVQDTVGAEPSLVLLEARKGGGSGIKNMPVLIVKNADGSETEEIRSIYRRKQNKQSQ